MKILKEDLVARAEKVFAAGCLTFSKHSSQFSFNTPSHAFGFDNGFLLGCDGESYIDWVGGLGANNSGTDNILSLPSIKELELAELLQSKINFLQRMRFLKSGSEACAAALRYARAYTGKKLVLGTGYHGYLNEFISEEAPGLGCTYSYYSKFANIEQLIDALEVNNEVAAVIIEPVELDDSSDRKAKVKYLRMLCKVKKVVFIVDEVVSGFRYKNLTVSQHWDLAPDLMVLGKALSGSGLSVVGGRACIMDVPGVFISTTFAGEVRPIEEAIRNLNSDPHGKQLQMQWMLGGRVLVYFNDLDPNLIKLIGYNTRMTWEADPRVLTIFWEQMVKRGHLVGRAFFVTRYHTSNMIDKFIEDSKEVIDGIKDGTYILFGDIPRPVFKRYEDKKNG
jgi:glutamate-1-semialdehyde aminotransferase